MQRNTLFTIALVTIIAFNTATAQADEDSSNRQRSDSKAHARPFKGTDEELQTLVDWLLEQKAEGLRKQRDRQYGPSAADPETGEIFWASAYGTAAGKPGAARQFRIKYDDAFVAWSKSNNALHTSRKFRPSIKQEGGNFSSPSARSGKRPARLLQDADVGNLITRGFRSSRSNRLPKSRIAIPGLLNSQRSAKAASRINGRKGGAKAGTTHRSKRRK